MAVRGHRRDPIQVGNPQGRVRDHLDQHQFRLWPHRRCDVCRVASVDKGALDAKAGQILGQQAQAAAIELVPGDDMVARAQQAQKYTAEIAPMPDPSTIPGAGAASSASIFAATTSALGWPSRA